MAFRSRRWGCDACGGEFRVLHEVINGIEEPAPRFCQLCGAENISDEPLPSQISIASVKGKTSDKVYRDMENASIERAHAAAEMAGVPVSEMSDLKITNMKDNLREGDTAVIHKTPQINVSREMAHAMQSTPNTGMTGQQLGQQYSQAAMTQGPSAGRHGASILEKIKTEHSSWTPTIVDKKTGRRAS